MKMDGRHLDRGIIILEANMQILEALWSEGRRLQALSFIVKKICEIFAWFITYLAISLSISCSNWTSIGASMPNLAPRLATSNKVRITCFSFLRHTRSSVSNMMHSITPAITHKYTQITYLVGNEPDMIKVTYHYVLNNITKPFYLSEIRVQNPFQFHNFA